MRYLHHIAPRLIVTLATLICIGIYWKGLYGPLLLDDISNLGNILSPNFGPNNILPNLFSDSGLLKRPVSMLSFIINGLFGNDLFYWKLTNLAIHLLSGILIFLLTKELTLAANTKSSLTAAIVAAVWILHPLQVSTVLYTVQRMTELSALFVFAAMFTYTIARKRQQKGETSWPMQAMTWLLFFPLGLLSKENALLLPIFILLLEIFFLSRKQLNNQQLLKIFFVALTLFIAILIIKSDWILSGYITRNFTLTERLYTESRILIAYLGMLLIPAQSRMGFAHDDVLISHSLIDPWTTLPSILIIIVLISISFFLRKKHPLIGFGILFFFAGHALESTIFQLELMYEHRNYLPSFGILLAAAATTNALIKNRIVIISFVITLFSLLIFITYMRAQTWSSTESLYYYMEMVHPHSERLATIKATQYTNIGEYSRARKRLENFTSMGAIFQRWNIDCAEMHTLKNQQLNIDFKSSRLADNYAIMQLTDLANLGLDNECTFSTDLFLDLLNKVAKQPSISRNNQQIISMYQAHYLWKTNRQEKALQTLHESFAINKKNPIPLFLACEWMLDTNRLKESEKTCSTALNSANKAPFNKYGILANKIRNRLNFSSKKPY